VVQSPGAEGNYLTSKEIQQGKRVDYNAVDPDYLLQENQKPPLIVWMMDLFISYFSRQISMRRALKAQYMAAWEIRHTEEVKCPVSSTCQELALWLDEQGYRDQQTFDPEKIEKGNSEMDIQQIHGFLCH
jgi:hypothetical protein